MAQSALLIYRYAVARLANHEEAEDVASEVFLEALKGIDQFRYQGKPILAWFYGIAKNLVSRRYREAKRTSTLFQVTEPRETALLGTDDPMLNRILLEDGFARLKPEHREVLTAALCFRASYARGGGNLGQKRCGNLFAPGSGYERPASADGLSILMKLLAMTG